MEEKVLIKSEVNKSLKLFLKWAPIILFGLAAIICLFLTFDYDVEVEYYSSLFHTRDTYTLTLRGWSWVFQFEPIGFFLWFLVACISLLASIIIGIIFLVNRKCELQVTENNVRGKAVLGKEVVLPLHMVSAYSTRKFLSVISVATASGVTKFSLIQNYKEIGEVLAKKINERQEKTETQIKHTYNNATSMDDLLKIKSLLDAGVITQEEFDAKKKQLLDL